MIHTSQLSRQYTYKASWLLRTTVSEIQKKGITVWELSDIVARLLRRISKVLWDLYHSLVYLQETERSSIYRLDIWVDHVLFYWQRIVFRRRSRYKLFSQWRRYYHYLTIRKLRTRLENITFHWSSLRLRFVSPVRRLEITDRACALLLIKASCSKIISLNADLRMDLSDFQSLSTNIIRVVRSPSHICSSSDPTRHRNQQETVDDESDICSTLIACLEIQFFLGDRLRTSHRPLWFVSQRSRHQIRIHYIVFIQYTYHVSWDG